MTVDVQVETTIARTPSDVATYAGDPSNAPEWYANIKSVEWQTPPPVAEGSRMDFVAQFLGRRLSYTYEVVALVPNEKLVMRTADGPFPMETTYLWEPVEGGDSDDAAQPRQPERVRAADEAPDGTGDAARDDQGPRPAQVVAGALIRTSR